MSVVTAARLLAGTGLDTVTELVVEPPVQAGNTVTLRYRLAGASQPALGTDSTLSFCETVQLPSEAPLPESLLDLLALCAGTSYFKVAAPPVVRLDYRAVPAEVRALGPHLYDHGLREFAVHNGLAVPIEVSFVWSDVTSASGVARADVAEPAAPLEVRPLVPVGGGKDSALVMSVFGDAAPFAIGPPVPSQRVAEASGNELIVAKRTIDQRLRTLNEHGALNGHIPITAITSVISVAVAYAGGYTDVLMGNERSASEPTRWVGSEPVNHQYSKSFEFEQVLAAAVQAVTGGAVRYFSVLRAFSELAIARGLAEDDAMMARFLSCNRAFTIWKETAERTTQTWCRNCPKCRFTYLMLAPFVERTRLAAIFGGDLLDDPAQIEGVADLWDLDSKPFECVGEMVESAVAMAKIADDPSWAGAAVVEALGTSARSFAAGRDGTMTDLLTPIAAHAIPAPYYERIAARLAPGGLNIEAEGSPR